MPISDNALFGLTVAERMEMEDKNALAAWPLPRLIGLGLSRAESRGPSCDLPPATPEDVAALREAAEEARVFIVRAEEACRLSNFALPGLICS